MFISAQEEREKSDSRHAVITNTRIRNILLEMSISLLLARVAFQDQLGGSPTDADKAVESGVIIHCCSVPVCDLSHRTKHVVRTFWSLVVLPALHRAGRFRGVGVVHLDNISLSTNPGEALSTNWGAILSNRYYRRPADGLSLRARLPDRHEDKTFLRC